MKDPVVASDGHSYDRASIETWFLTGSRCSPMTNLPLESLHLIPNVALRAVIAALPQPVKVNPADAAELQVTLHSSAFGSVLKIESTLVPLPSIHVVAAVDVSGSMNSAATVGAEDNGVSLLDLVKKCLEMLVKMLGPNDLLSLVTYSSEVRVLARCARMTEDGKSKILDDIQNLRTGGMTNYFGSLKTSFELCAGVDNSVVFNFTDGHPNVKEPPRGYAHALGCLREKGPLPSVYAFGFGNELSSAILVKTAEICNGCFVHIPTVNFVGTSFGHAIANVRETLRRGVRVVVQFHKDGEQVQRSFQTSLKNGTSIALPMPEVVEVGCASTITITTAEGTVLCTLRSDETTDVDAQRSTYALVHQARYSLVCFLRQLMCTKRDPVRDGAWVQACTERTLAMLQACAEGSHAQTLRGFLTYFQGEHDDDAQVLKALDLTETAYWDTWGKHYVASLYFALHCQECHNFKDVGVQGFGGDIFESARDKASALYMTLPPIVPSRVYGAATTTVCTQQYHCSGGCFDGRALVTKVVAENQRLCPLYGLRRGDQVVAGDGSIAVIECLLHTPCDVAPMCRFQTEHSYVNVTPYHPLSLDGGATWFHPNTVAAPEQTATPFGIYSFLLEKRSNGRRAHSLRLGAGVAGIGLAHGLRLPASVQSPFWDTEEVVSHVRKLPGFARGKAILSALVRHPITHLAVGLV